MADDDYGEVPGSVFNEGAPQAGRGDYPDPAGIYEGFSDMYGGPFGRLAQGGVTGMPGPFDGGSGPVVPGADGGSSTPPNWNNQLLNPNGLPVPQWTPQQGRGENAGIQPLLDATAQSIASAAAAAPRQVNSGLWGVPGTGWTDKWPVPVPQQAAADQYQNMPTKHRTGPRVDPYFEIHPSVDWTNDFNAFDSPYEYQNWPFPDNQVTPIGDVVTFPGNPANDNNPTGPNGAPHNWDTYRRQAALARAIAAALQGNLGQGL